MTKEEIKIWLHNNVPQMGEELLNKAIDSLHTKLSEYAEQEAKGFALFASKGFDKSLKGDLWLQHGNFEYITTAQLYQIFKSQQNATAK